MICSTPFFVLHFQRQRFWNSSLRLLGKVQNDVCLFLPHIVLGAGLNGRSDGKVRDRGASAQQSPVTKTNRRLINNTPSCQNFDSYPHLLIPRPHQKLLRSLPLPATNSSLFASNQPVYLTECGVCRSRF